MVGGATSGPIIRAACKMVVPFGTSISIPSIVTFILFICILSEYRIFLLNYLLPFLIWGYDL